MKPYWALALPIVIVGEVGYLLVPALPYFSNDPRRDGVLLVVLVVGVAVAAILVQRWKAGGLGLLSEAHACCTADVRPVDSLARLLLPEYCRALFRSFVTYKCCRVCHRLAPTSPERCENPAFRAGSR